MVEFTVPLLLDVIRTAGILVGIVYYITTVRNQNKARQLQILKGANLIGSYMNPLYEAEFTDSDDFKEKYDIFTSNEVSESFFRYFNVLEELGVYVKEGLLDVKYVAQIGGGAIIGLWEKYMVVHEMYREMYGKRWFIEAEYLYDRVKDYFQMHPELLE
jgi:hypothetical protein